MRIKSIIIALALSFMAAQGLFASNTITKVDQVNDGITLSSDVDYIITGATPFGSVGSVNITNTDHAVLIINSIRPSKVISSYLRSHVYINGVQASNGVNCQVKMYGTGSIILPYKVNCNPLTVYSEQNFGGTSVNSFGLENTGGYMNTLTDEKLNNKIRSFKLKRGYMVTFSTRASGRGYSRCFIADKEDLEFATLPTVLDGTISSYRIFSWYDSQKKGLANNTSATDNTKLGTSTCYSFGLGESQLPDFDCVPHHIYEDWPSSSACGGVTYSCHMKTNNEPGNSSDDHPQTVDQVLNNWENLMRTGMRLCSESSHDGSWSHLRAFIDSIDARGWRCDILDLHCYWNSGFSNMASYYSSYGNRPIWISEWVWGASWNSNGIFSGSDRTASTAKQQDNLARLQEIIPSLEDSKYVERYFYWNSEADCSKLLLGDGTLTLGGNYYANYNSNIGYNKDVEKIPTNPRMYNPSNLVAEYDKNTKTVKLTWHEVNGEYNQSMVIQQKKPGSSIWTTVATPEQQELEADYEYTVDGVDGYKYRVSVVDVAGKTRLTNEAQAVNDNLEVGDAVTVGDKTLYMGGNMLVNGDFDLGLADWQNGAGEPLAAPYFEAVPCGGVDGGSYLQAYGNSTDKKSEQSLRKVITLNKYSYYYVQAAGCNGPGTNQRIATTTLESIELNTKVSLPAITQWAKQGVGFQTTLDSILTIQFRSCNAKSQFDKVVVAKLFSTKDSALADALEWAKKRAEAFKQYNTMYPQFNNEVDEYLAIASTAEDIEDEISQCLLAIQKMPELDALIDRAETAAAAKCSNYEMLNWYVKTAKMKESSLITLTSIKGLTDELNASFSPVEDKTTITNADFSASSNYWTVKSGTYTSGDQRSTTQAGKSCWNAWWSTPASGGSETTMAVNRNLTKLAHGFYAVSALAATQHYCLTDQHAFLTKGGETYNSQPLHYGVLDLASVEDADKWETLTTPYVYVSESDTINVGFMGSKNGAVDGLWHAYDDATSTGDNREGWWCATDFTLQHVLAFRDDVNASKWGTVCLPYTFEIPENVVLYKVAGMLSDSTRICIEPVTETEAGAPYIYRVEGEDSGVYFFETGAKVTSAQTNVNGLRGMFTASANYPVNSLVLVGDEWKVIATSADRFKIKNYAGFIYKTSNLPKLDSWDGEYLWTKGLVSDEKIEEAKAATGIESVANALPATDDSSRYSISGQRVGKSAKGIIVSKNRKSVVK